jgi:serine/threonine protein kinase
VNPSPEPPDTTAGDDPRLLRATQEYLAELEAGRRPRRADFVARFPDLADALAPYLDALDMMHSAAPLLHSASAPKAVPDATLPAEPLGDFRIVREIGRGGMGVVYEAVQMSLGRPVALKVLPFAAALDAKHLQRFKNEAQAAAHLHHTNIVPVYAVGCERGVHFYAMQLIDGINLADLIARMRPRPEIEDRGSRIEDRRREQPPRPGAPTGLLDPRSSILDPPSSATAHGAAAELSTQRASGSAGFYRTAAGLVIQAAEALEYAHQLGVIHRDVKPANLLVDARGNLWVTDFGLAQFHTNAGLTRTGDLLGTLRYMSPEQAAGQHLPLDPRTDVYSLGATLYELLTLEPLCAAADHPRLLRQILEDDPRPLRAVDRSVPDELETIVLKAVSKNPADRYATARAFADDLRRFLDHRPILARRPTLVQQVRKWGRRHPAVVVAGVVLLVLVTAVSLVSAWLVQGAYQRERQRAEEAEERFRLHRQSVDDMIKISEQELADKPHLDGLRKRLLESALVYYQEFIKQRHDDPRAHADLVATQERVKKILSDLAVLQGAWQFHLLGQPAVLDDLDLPAEGRKKIEELSHRLDRQRGEMFKDFGRLSNEERRKRFLELARTADAEVREVLDRHHLERLQQIALQVKGASVFRDPEVAGKLKLTPEQRERIAAIEAETFFVFGPDGRRGGGPAEGKPPAGPDEIRKIQEQKFRAAKGRALEVLTKEQRQRWEELTGKPFTGPVMYLQVGPPPGPFVAPAPKPPPPEE